MKRQTSIAAYHKIRNEGLLSKRRWEVYDVMYHNGPLTSGEAFTILNRNRPAGALTQSRARFTELRELGLLREIGVRKCSVTGMNVILWDVTDKLPMSQEERLAKEGEIQVDMPW